MIVPIKQVVAPAGTEDLSAATAVWFVFRSYFLLYAEDLASDMDQVDTKPPIIMPSQKDSQVEI